MYSLKIENPNKVWSKRNIQSSFQSWKESIPNMEINTKLYLLNQLIILV